MPPVWAIGSTVIPLNTRCLGPRPCSVRMVRVHTSLRLFPPAKVVFVTRQVGLSAVPPLEPEKRPGTPPGRYPGVMARLNVQPSITFPIEGPISAEVIDGDFLMCAKASSP